MMIPRFLVARDIAPDFAVHAMTGLPDLGLFKRFAQQHVRGLQGHLLWYRAEFLSCPMILKEIAISCHYDGERAMNGFELKPLSNGIGWGSQSPVLPDVSQDFPPA